MQSMLFIIGGLLRRLLDGLQELPVYCCPCECEFLENQPPKKNIEHLDYVADRVYPKILNA